MLYRVAARARRPKVLPAAARRFDVFLAGCRNDPIQFIEYVFDIQLEEVQRQWVRMWQHSSASVLHGAVGLGKSLLVRGFVLWLLGNDDREQVLWLGATQRQPKKSLRTVAKLIESESVRSRLHEVFPKLRPGTLWRSVEIEIDRDVDPLDADPTIQVFGAYSDSVLGSRATTLVIDDLCNFTNTLTQDSRDKMIEWLGSVFSRLTRENVRIIVLGNLWHENDATGEFARKKGGRYMRTPAYTIDEETGERILTAPRALGEKRLNELEGQLTPIQAARMLACEIADLELGRFRREAFAEALRKGQVARIGFRPQRVLGSCFTGVDLGHTAKLGSDLTAMVTIQVMPDNSKHIIDVRSGRWTSMQIKRELEDVHLRYGSIIGVESNGGQNLLTELVSHITAIPLQDRNTGVNKYDKATGIEAIAFELERGFWAIPCPALVESARGLDVEDDEDGDQEMAPSWTLGRIGDPHPEVQALINEALTFDPHKHTGDRLMAWWIACETLRKSLVGMMDDVEAAIDDVVLDIFAR